jgi:prepilin-type N-terminal cleavage/methylation domain-containing protein
MFINASKKRKGFTQHCNSAGFTMLEMIIVVFVFLTGIVGVYSIIQNYYTTAIYSSNRLIASYLSQEGIELIKNLRDNNLIEDDSWTKNITDDCSSGIITCKIDYNDAKVLLDNGPSQAFLKKEANSFYNYDAGSPTIFKRKIKIIVNSSYINVSVETEWYKKNLTTIDGSVKVQDNLYGYWQ